MTNLHLQQQKAAELRFAFKIRQVLEASTESLSDDRLERLAAARKAALRSQKAPSAKRVLAPAMAFSRSGNVLALRGSGSPLGRFALVASMVLVLSGCLTGLFEFEKARHIQELADIDEAVLTDDVPISTYADHGFNAFVKQNG